MPRLLAVLGRVRSRFRAVLGFSLLFGVLEAAVVAPLAALTLRLFLSTTGRASVGNFEIARFLVSLTGVVTLLVVGAVTVAGAYLHVAGLLRILGDPPATVGETLRSLARDGHRLLRLGLLEIGSGVVIAAPFLVVMLLAVKGIWGDRDLNGLLVLKPPVFWYGIAAAAVPTLVMTWLLVRLFVRWLFALPILLEEPGILPVQAALRSRERVRGRQVRVLRALATWAGVVLLLSFSLFTAFRAAGGWFLGLVGARMSVALPATAGVLALWIAVSALFSWIATALLAGLIDRLNREATGRPPAAALPAGPDVPVGVLRRVLAGLAALALLTGVAAFFLLKTHSLPDRVEITAHRAGATTAPENTVAAIRKAIADGADWAEIDVQLTSDGALVVLHDFDLLRIGGPGKQVAAATFEEIRAIDVGGGLKFPSFAGEKVPTLDEVIAAAGDRIRLNIELKPPTAEAVAPLTDAVLAVVRKAGLVGRCHFCSQSYEALRRAKEAEPGLGVGYIAGAALGDLAGLEVDFLMVNAGIATRRFVRKAHAEGIAVHPWTINDPDMLLPLLDHQVDNVITDDPAALRARLDEIRALSSGERLLLRMRTFLAD